MIKPKIKRGPGRPFKKGNAGKKKGTPNKITRTVKETVLKIFNDIQSDPKVKLLTFAKKHPRDFYQIASRLIPTELSGSVGVTTTINVTAKKPKP